MTPELRGRIAVVTGAGTGIGRELVVQLAGDGYSVAACDIHHDDVVETASLAQAAGHPAASFTSHTCDVADEEQVLRVRDEVREQHETTSVNLVFNNAGVHGTTSFVLGDRAEWDRIFAVCWTGVYNVSRAFVPLLVASDAGWLVNTSSVNGFWATSSAYSTAKFAVKGFSEALIADFRENAPHVKVAVVMPGYIGTDILRNSRRVLADADDVPSAMTQAFRAAAPTSAAQAATAILDDIRSGNWRILVGADAKTIDRRVRSDPVGVYGPNGLKLEDVIGSLERGGSEHG